MDDSFKANTYNVVVGAVKAMRILFDDRDVSSKGLLDYGKITERKEAMLRNTRLDDALMTSTWEGLAVAVQSRE